MTLIGKILYSKGITNRGFVNYGDGQSFFNSCVWAKYPNNNYNYGQILDLVASDPTVTQAGINTYAKPLGFILQAWVASSLGFSASKTFAQNYPEGAAVATSLKVLQQNGMGWFAPLDCWGYYPQDTLATQFPDLKEYAVYPHPPPNGALTVETLSQVCGSTGVCQSDGIVIDNINTIINNKWSVLLQQMNTNIPLSGFIGMTSCPLSDWYINAGRYSPPVGDANWPTVEAGHNVNSYARYVQTQYFTQTINAQGNHASDNSPCLLYQAYISKSISQPVNPPPLTFGIDVDTYHKNPHGSPLAYYSLYLGEANISLEYQILQQYQTLAGSAGVIRSAFLISEILQNSQYFNQKNWYLTCADSNSWIQTISATGGDNAVRWFNLCNPQDNPFSLPTNQDILNFCLQDIPNTANQPFYEVDTLDPDIYTFPQTTSWPHFAQLLNKIPNLNAGASGFFGFEESPMSILNIGKFDYFTHTPLYMIGRVWSTSDNQSLSNFNLSSFDALFGISSNPTDISNIETYVQNGGTVVTYVVFQNGSGWSSALNNLYGVSYQWTGDTNPVTLQVPNPSHPMLAPYAATDLISAFSQQQWLGGNIRTIISSTVTPLITDLKHGPVVWINNFGKGKVICISIGYYGEGFSGNSAGQGDGLASGLAYLTLNAFTWAKGLPTPAIYLPKYTMLTSWAAPRLSNNEGQFSGIVLTLLGNKAGQKLIWISNSNTSQVNGFNPIFSSAFFGFSNPWSFTDLNSGNNINGTGDVALNSSLVPQDWSLLLQSTSARIDTNLTLQVIQS